MKNKVTKIIGIGILVAALAVPVTVLARGWGWGGRHMMGNWGMAPGSMMNYGHGYQALTPEQRTQLDQLDRKFYDETADMRKDLWNKSTELNALLNTTDPDLDKVKALNKEINDLRTTLNEKRLTHELEARKVRDQVEVMAGLMGTTWVVMDPA
jgi:zinc resistance-associated protein